MKIMRLLRNADGGIDDALGLVVEVAIFTVIFVFAGVLIGSATAQAMSEVVANHLAAVEVSGNTKLLNQESTSEAQQYLQASVVQTTTSVNQCNTTANACVVLEPCSASSPACVIVVERRVMIPIVDSPVIWSAKATSIWQPGA